MKITICGSIALRLEMVGYRNALNKIWHEAIIHPDIEDLAFRRNTEMQKKIFLLNQVPDISYAEEIKAMADVMINGDMTKIK